MLKVIARRLLQAIPTLWVILTLTFVLLRLAPGGPFDQERAISPEIEARQMAHYGLDKPLVTQYFIYLGNVLKGDLGPSFKYADWTVNEVIAYSFPTSLELGLLAMLIALAVGIPLGVVAALYHNKPADGLLMAFAVIGICLPSFVLGPILLLLFSTGLGWFNPLGWNYPGDRLLPAITLGLYFAAYIARLSRTGMLDVMRSDFIRTARAKGLSETKVVVVHALRTALMPVTSYLGPAFAGLISGSFVVETIFFIPGLGRYFVNSAFNRDYTMVMGLVLFYAVLIIAFNLIVDLLLMWMNPRNRHD